VTARLTEQQLLDRILHLAERTGWAVHHDRPARRAGAGWHTAIAGHAGFPDLVLARRGVVLFRELKGYQASGLLGRVSSEQRDWGQQLWPGWRMPHVADETANAARRGWLFDVWTPDDWDPLIVPTLTAKASVSHTLSDASPITEHPKTPART
jgi:hypothetical protein